MGARRREASRSRGNFADAGRLHPAAAASRRRRTRSCSATSGSGRASAYCRIPGYRLPEGPLGEYNGKFMSNQMVLRGGSCLTPRGHVRATYRNFFPPATRWQMSGIRLARDL